ncbi:MAG TPA: M48 family peptidase, partial [Planctomycetota bacterium]|nr:M48 family peptidase [Planctomycetota bacterium]
MKSRATLLLIPVVFLFLGIFGCGTTPYTNRSQLLLLGHDQEIALGLQAYEQQVGQARMSSNARYRTMVETVGQRIAAIVERDHKTKYQWEFRVIAEPTVNAFALPG